MTKQEWIERAATELMVAGVEEQQARCEASELCPLLFGKFDGPEDAIRVNLASMSSLDAKPPRAW